MVLACAPSGYSVRYHPRHQHHPLRWQYPPVRPRPGKQSRSPRDKSSTCASHAANSCLAWHGNHGSWGSAARVLVVPTVRARPSGQSLKIWRARLGFLVKALIAPPKGQPRAPKSCHKLWLARHEGAAQVSDPEHGSHSSWPDETRLLARHPEPIHPPVFIMGPPRSGTSLFYELLVTRYDLAFFSNLAHPFLANACCRD